MLENSTTVKWVTIAANKNNGYILLSLLTPAHQTRYDAGRGNGMWPQPEAMRDPCGGVHPARWNHLRRNQHQNIRLQTQCVSTSWLLDFFFVKFVISHSHVNFDRQKTRYYKIKHATQIRNIVGFCVWCEYLVTKQMSNICHCHCHCHFNCSLFASTFGLELVCPWRSLEIAASRDVCDIWIRFEFTLCVQTFHLTLLLKPTVADPGLEVEIT